VKFSKAVCRQEEKRKASRGKLAVDGVARARASHRLTAAACDGSLARSHLKMQWVQRTKLESGKYLPAMNELKPRLLLHTP
jgi:hypothetical protein